MDKTLNEMDYCNIFANGNLEDVAEALEKQIDEPLMILDNRGYPRYPATFDGKNPFGDLPSIPMKNLFNEVDLNLSENEHKYDEKTKYFCYAIGSEQSRAYIVIENMEREKIQFAADGIKIASTVIGLYFLFYNKSRAQNRTFEKNMLDFFFTQGSANLATFTKMCDLEIDINRSFIVSVSSIHDKTDKKVDRELIRSYATEFFRRMNRDCVASIDNDKLLLLIPQENQKNRFEMEEWPPPKSKDGMNLLIEKALPVELSTGIGTPRTLKYLHEGYREAIVALTVPTLMGKRHYVQEFSNLGIFSILFSSCFDELKAYTKNTLERLLDYDKIHGSDLFSTLKELIGNNFNRKQTADNLYIHINTLKYRINKIENLLNKDMNNSIDSIELHLIVLFYITMTENGWLD